MIVNIKLLLGLSLDTCSQDLISFPGRDHPRNDRLGALEQSGGLLLRLLSDDGDSHRVEDRFIDNQVVGGGVLGPLVLFIGGFDSLLEEGLSKGSEGGFGLGVQRVPAGFWGGEKCPRRKRRKGELLDIFPLTTLKR